MSAPLALIEQAELLGRYRYVELSCFARLGARALAVEEASLCSYLSGASAAHGYRARLLEEHLPFSVGLPGPAELTRSPGAAFDHALSALIEAGDDELVSGLVQVLYVSMAASYRVHRQSGSVYGDPALSRSLGRVLFDLEQVIEAGSAFCARKALPRPAAALEKALIGLGGAFGQGRAGGVF